MGQDKALLLFEGRPLGLRAAELVQQVCGNVTIVGDPAKFLAWRFPVTRDLYPDRGPLGGIHAALQHPDARLALVVGCDMPYLTPEFLEFLVGLARESEADAVIPKSEAAGHEPLCAVYARSCLAPIEQALQADQGKISDVLGQLRLRLIHPAEWKTYDPEGRLFRNLNTPEEYKQARRERFLHVPPARA
jgi:molybdopterin-guanine dinucleotide biosynthesis protein A